MTFLKIINWGPGEVSGVKSEYIFHVCLRTLSTKWWVHGRSQREIEKS
jgi:hypothetical protein